MIEERSVLHPERFFDPDPAVRAIARDLYTEIKDLPIISPHGHVEARLFAENKAFPDPAQLIIVPDHYLFRMLYSQGIALEDIGIRPLDGSVSETDSRKIWQRFCDHFYLFAGTPSGIWLTHELVSVFDVDLHISSETAMSIYDQISEKLTQASFLPRTLFQRFNIEVLSTTDGACDTLRAHQQIKDSGWSGRIIPCLRPDDVTNLNLINWRQNIHRLSEITGVEVASYNQYIQAIEKQRQFFKAMGAVSTDHGIEEPFTRELNTQEADALFQKGLKGKATPEDARQFTGHMMMEMARMSVEDGLVMQLHPGCHRNHNQMIFERFGADKGADIPVQTEYTQNLKALLNKYGNHPAFTLIVFTLDESTYSRELAPLAGHYPAMKLGPAWWFHDSVLGMTRHREHVVETAGIYNLIGFIDDTRAYPSIPARHDVARRVDSNYLAGLVARHIIDMDEARTLNHALAYDLSKKAYRL
jgi:glucuronate isomerase